MILAFLVPMRRSGASQSPPSPGSGAVGQTMATHVVENAGGSTRAARRPSPWARIVTNAQPIELHRIAGDLEYSARVRRHVQLRALLRSPARETPECIQVGLAAIAHGFPLEIVPMAYRYAWERRAIAAALGRPEDQAEREIRLDMADADFSMLMKRVHGRDEQGFLGAVRAIEPVTAFGHLETGIRDGEALLEE